MIFYNDNLDESKIAKNENEMDVDQFNKISIFCVDIVFLFLK